ncbi:MAG: GH32 C-terminal domain-containing protein, partial [Nitriliruptoraceae bacterium]
EVTSLRRRQWSIEEPDVEAAARRLREVGVAGDALDITARIDVGEAEEVGLRVRVGDGEATTIGYAVGTTEVFVDRRRSGDVTFSHTFPGVYPAPLPLDDGVLDLRVLVDRSSVEVYAGDGRVVLTQQVFPDPDSIGVEVYAAGGATGATDLQIWELDPAAG